MASQINTTIRAVSVISPKRDEVSTPAEQNAFVVSAETTYDEIALQLVADLNNFGDEANILSTEVSANATSAEQDALTASSVVNSKGAWSGLTGALNIPASVTHTGSVWVLNVNIADVTLSEPTDVNTDWTEVSGVTQAELDLKEDITANDAKLLLKASAKLDLSVVVTPPTNADYTLTADENLYGRIEIDTTNWTVARNIITDNIEHTFLAVVNTTGSQNATFKTSAGSGVLVESGTTTAKELRNNTVNIIDYEVSFDSSNLLDTSSTAQTKIGDLTIGELVAVTSWSYSGTTITINTAAIHNLIVGQYFRVDGLVATTNAPNGRWQVATVVDADTVTFTAVDTPTGTASVSSATLSHGDITLKGSFKEFDLGQTWQDVTGSRVVGTLYTNTTGRQIMVNIISSANAWGVEIDGVILIPGATFTYGRYISIIVPSGSTYKFTHGTLDKWIELR